MTNRSSEGNWFRSSEGSESGLYHKMVGVLQRDANGVFIKAWPDQTIFYLDIGKQKLMHPIMEIGQLDWSICIFCFPFPCIQRCGVHSFNKPAWLICGLVL